MNHVEAIKKSLAVDNHLVSDFKLKNRSGQLWTKFAHLVIGAKDCRPRVGNLTTPWEAQYDKTYPMPELKYVDYRLHDLFDQRAFEVFEIAKSMNKRIAIMWSGGIDSTAVLVSFIKNLNDADLKLIDIVMSSESIIENFDFYKNHISNKFRCIQLLDFDMCNETLEKYILLHGDPGDAVFGPTLPAFRHLVADGRHNLPYKDNQPLIAEFFDRDQSIHSDPEFGNWYVNRITKNLIESGPENVKTISDWWWWHYMNFKWPTAIVRPFMHLRKDYKKPIDQKHHKDYAFYSYFNTDAFVQWSYTNLPYHFEHVNKGRAGVKLEAKKYIFEFDRNQAYADQKTKIASKSPDFERRIVWISPLYYDHNWVGYHAWEPGVTEAATELLESFQG
jgi:hypothetical protein